MKKKIFTILLSFTFIFFVFAPTAHAQLGLEETAGRAGLYKAGEKQENVLGIIGNIIGTALGLISIIFFVHILYAGFRWMVARGNEDEIRTAQDTIIAAIVGIIIVVAAYTITTFVFKRLGPQQATPEDVQYCAANGQCTKFDPKGSCVGNLFNSLEECNANK